MRAAGRAAEKAIPLFDCEDPYREVCCQNSMRITRRAVEKSLRLWSLSGIVGDFSGGEG